MRKSILLLTVLLLRCVTLTAGDVFSYDAQAIAAQFFSTEEDSVLRPTRDGVVLSSVIPQAYYVFNRLDGAGNTGHGFVLIAGDDRIPPVLGYSDKGSFDPDDMPENVAAWLKGLEDEINEIKEMDDNELSRARSRTRGATSRAAIEPLVPSKWNQDLPYNLMCPDGNGTDYNMPGFNAEYRCITGCVATAMAQVMYYHKWPETCTLIPGYSYSDNYSGTLGELSATTFKWDKMKDTYYRSETGDAANAVAELMRYCGQSVEMMYGPSGSGVYSDVLPKILPEALTKYFGYKKSLKYIERSSYTAEQWEELIYQELSKGHPVLYNGFGGGGHQFICDGYEENEQGDHYFNFNWGWGGYKDGHYLLSLKDFGRFYEGQCAVIGLEPDRDDNTAVGITFTDKKVENICLTNWDTNSDGKLTEAEAAAVTDLGMVFKGNREITSFEELEYFTGLTTIANSAFSGCKSLTSIQIPKTVKTIGNSAFSGSGLTTLSIPNSVVIIEKCAFQDCRSLSFVTIGSSVKSIESAAFTGCENLTGVNISNLAAWAQLSFGTVAGTNPLQYAQKLFLNNKEITELVIPDEVTSIGQYAFYNCSNITSMTIPSGVISIGPSAFYGCTGLTSVTSYINEPMMTGWVYPSSVYDNATLYVPIGTKSLYENSPEWRQFENIVEMGNDNNDDVIVFADANVKAICVANWDTNRDGELSKTEAAAVTDLGNVFADNNDITSFGELQYFTGLTKLFGTFSNCNNLTYAVVPRGVTNISSTFYECRSLTSVKLPIGLTYIGSGTFKNCWQLKSINIPKTVSSISGKAFTDCLSLEEVHISDLAAWCMIDGTLSFVSFQSFEAQGSFKSKILLNGKELTGKITIPDGVTRICDYAFYGCSGITSITIPSGITSIGSYAFGGCSGITSINIPNGVTDIGRRAFFYCSNLASISIPQSVASLGNGAFYGTAWYNNMADGVVYINNIAYKCKGTLPANSSIQLKNGTIGIADDAFAGQQKLISVTIPNSVKSIGSSAFSGSGLQSIVIPNSVTSIGRDAFNNCGGLTSVSIGNGVTSIEQSTFESCSNLTTVSIGNNVTSIGDYAFNYCDKISSIKIPNSVKSIGDWAFGRCKGLTSITIGNGLEAVGDRAFYDCNGLTEVNISDLAAWCKIKFGEDEIIANNNPLYYAQHLNLNGKKVTSLIIPEGVTTIGDLAFYNCKDITSVTIPNSVEFIGAYAFQGTAWYENQPDGLIYLGDMVYKYKGTMPENTTITIKDGTTGIIGGAFAGCKTLTSVDIPESVTFIGGSAFSNCKGLSSVIIPSGVTRIDYQAFQSSGLTEVVSFIKKPFGLKEGQFSFEQVNNNTSLYVPKGSKPLYENALGWKDFKEIVEFDDTQHDAISAKTFGDVEPVYVYEGYQYRILDDNTAEIVLAPKAEDLEGEIEIPSSMDGHKVISIGVEAFCGRSYMTSVTIPSTIENIGDYAFMGCQIGNNGLQKVIFSEDSKLKNIGNWVFSSCNLLETISIPNSVTTIGEGAFFNCEMLSSAIHIPEGVKTIEKETFKYCNSLTNITIPSSVNAIMDDAFNGCEQLSAIEIPVGVTSIGNGAFFDCKALVKVVIPKGVKEIGDGAFRDCDNLRTLSIPSSIELNEDGTAYKLGRSAFDSDNLTTVYSFIENPTAGHNESFTFHADKPLTLYVPRGSKAAYFEKWAHECDYPTIIELGDANGNGTITITDAALIVNHLLGKASSKFNVVSADTNGNGQITITDAALIVRWLLNGTIKSRNGYFNIQEEKYLDPQ